MGDYIAKWHRELGIFCRIKPLIIVEGNVLDVYQYPVDGSTPKRQYLKTSRIPTLLLHGSWIQNYCFFDSMQGVL